MEQSHLAIIASVLALILPVTPLSATPENLTQNISSSTANIKIGKTVEVTRLEESEGTVYLDGQFDKDADMVSGRTHIYSLREFLARNTKKQP